MDPLVAERLRQLNRAFYERHATSFAATRSAPWPGWSVVPAKPPASIRSVLDLGCGNGRYLQLLRDRGFSGRYLGVDGSKELLAIASETFSAETFTVEPLAAEPLAVEPLTAEPLTAEPPTAEPVAAETFAVEPPAVERVAVRPQASWHHAQLEEALGANPFEGETFELVVAWGVLHHVPGFDARLTMLRQMLARVAPGGVLAVSFWQFRKHARFAAHECDPLPFGLTGLEDGDALLDWQGERAAPRYCHHFSDEEIERIRAAFPRHESELTRLEETSDRFNAYLALRV